MEAKKINKKNQSRTNRFKNNGHPVKFMCGVLVFVAKFSASQTGLKI